MMVAQEWLRNLNTQSPKLTPQGLPDPWDAWQAPTSQPPTSYSPPSSGDWQKWGGPVDTYYSQANPATDMTKTPVAPPTNSIVPPVPQGITGLPNPLAGLTPATGTPASYAPQVNPAAPAGTDPRTKPPGTVRAGTGAQYAFENGRLKLRWSTHSEGVNSRVLRSMADAMRQNPALTEQQAYDQAVRFTTGLIAQTGAAPDTYDILDYGAFKGLAQPFAQSGFNYAAMWQNPAFGGQLNRINAVDNGTANPSAPDRDPVTWQPSAAPGQPAPAPAPGTAPPPLAPGQPVPGAPPPAAAPGAPGSLFLSEAEMGSARDSQDMAIAAYRRARGQSGRDKSIMGGYREDMMGKALRAYLTMLGPDGTNVGALGQANTGIAGMMAALASGNGVGNTLRAQASQMMGRDLSGYDDQQLLAMMGAAGGAGGFGYGPFAQYALDNNFEDMKDAAQQAFLAGNTSGVLNQPTGRKKFIDVLDRYLNLR